MHRIFLCDDSAGYRALLRSVFEAEPDLEVIGEASNGEQCIARIADLSPDVVLLDLNMPRLGGLEALPALIAAAPRTHFVVLTSAPPAEAETASLTAGAHTFIQKPNNPLGLPNVLRERLRILDRRRRPRSG